jgi:drug/metabolite transporter (DMT)-like permease
VTPLAVVLVLISQFAQVGGQVLLKRGMSELGKTPRRRAPVLWGLGGGIAMLTAWFGLWMGLMQKLDLSLLYPFTGLSPVLMVLAAGVFLRERADWRTWLGVALIAAGTVLVSFSVPVGSH